MFGVNIRDMKKLFEVVFVLIWVMGVVTMAEVEARTSKRGKGSMWW